MDEQEQRIFQEKIQTFLLKEALPLLFGFVKTNISETDASDEDAKIFRLQFWGAIAGTAITVILCNGDLPDDHDPTQLARLLIEQSKGKIREQLEALQAARPEEHH